MDVVVPNMVRALVIHGPVYGAEAKAIRADAARKMPGVIGVFATARGVAVVAEKYWQALAAAPLVEVDWTAGTVAGFDTAKLRAASHAHPQKGESARSDGNVDKAMRSASIALEATYDVPYLAHATLEPQNCTVHVQGDKAEVWAPCQSPSIVQVYVADALGIAADDVLVHTTFCGGGFGRRIIADWAEQAARIARQVGRPVQLVWSREDDMTQAFYRPQGTARLRGSVSTDGRKAGSLAVHLISQSIALDDSTGIIVRSALVGVPHAVQGTVVRTLTGMVGSNTITDMFATEGLANTPYAIDNLDMSFTPVQSKLPIASWRSVGNSVTGFLVEGFVDELARAAKQDPYLFRRNMLKADSRQLPVLDRVAAMAQWGKRTPGIGRGIARHFSFETEVAEVADVEIVDGRIKVRRVWAAVDCGIAVNPDIVKAQVEGAILFGLSAALDQQITIVNGVVQQTSFDTFPALRMNECPEIHVDILDIDREPTGIGEPGLPPIGPAVANAIFDLTGIRLRRLPLQLAFDEARKS
jgi:CO/xanthine dehydrogenase Mo-binding subunit